jgi:hypothetical protein
MTRDSARRIVCGQLVRPPVQRKPSTGYPVAVPAHDTPKIRVPPPVFGGIAKTQGNVSHPPLSVGHLHSDDGATVLEHAHAHAVVVD